MNWRYTYNKEDMIVSNEEHQQILEGIRQKGTLVILRGGKLGINPAFVRKFVETQQLTDEQEVQRTKQLSLEERPYQAPTPSEREANRKKHDEFMMKFGGKKINWDMNSHA